MSDNITLPREVVEKAVKAFENGCPPTCEKGMIDSGGFHPWGEPALVPCPTCLAFEHLRTALAAEQPKHDLMKWAKDAGSSPEDLERFATYTIATRDMEIATLREENEALRRDAERYRWMTEDHPEHETRRRVYSVTLLFNAHRKEHIDAAIDAAMGDKT